MTQVDRTGQIPTTDGSEGSYQDALDHMNDTYGEQQDSTHPSQENNDTGNDKSNNHSGDTSYDDSFVQGILKSIRSWIINAYTNFTFDKVSKFIETAAGELAEQIVIYTNKIKGFRLAPVNGYYPNFTTNADDIARLAAKTAKGATKVAGAVTGGILDYSLQVYTGEDKKDAFIKSVLHVMIGVAVTAAGITSWGAFAMVLFGTFVVDTVYDNADGIINSFNKFLVLV